MKTEREMLEKAENNTNGWISDNVYCYRINDEDIFSIYVLSDEKDFDEDNAEEILERYNITDIEYIETDKAVAEHLGFKYCFTFHEQNITE